MTPCSISDVFNLPPPGKPNPEIRNKINTPDCQKRVVQTAQKGPVCWYYAFNIIRKRIGKFPSEGQEKARDFELSTSMLRKALTKIDEDYQQQFEQLNRIVTILNEIPSIRENSSRNALEQAAPSLFQRESEVYHFLDRYIHSNIDNLTQFVDDEWQRIEENLHVRQIAEYLVFLKKHITKSIEQFLFLPCYESATLKEKGATLNSITIQICGAKYGFIRSCLKLNSSFDCLLQELILYKQLVVVGFYGPAYYDIPAQKVGMIENTPIYGWSPGAIRKSLGDSHVVVLVGASKSRNEVYYVDPIDESKPDLPRKVYAMSYQIFKDYLMTNVETSNAVAFCFAPSAIKGKVLVISLNSQALRN